jgi:hypothetical protein
VDEPAPSFGALLRRARTERGLSLEAVARETRLASRYLLALEDESIDALPGGVYNRAYVRTYAKYVGLDADGLVRDYDLQAQARADGGRPAAQQDAVAAMRAVAKQKESQPAVGRLGVEPPRARVVVLRSVAFVVLAGGVWAGTRHFTHSPEVLARPSSSPPAVAVRDPVVIESVAISAIAREPVSLAVVSLAVAERESFQIPIPDRHEAPTMSVYDSGVGTAVIDRQLVGRADAFAAGTRVVFWTLVTGWRAGDTIRHVWVHQGRRVATVKLPIRGASWRTHSQRPLPPGADGEWVVEARDDAGRVLARHVFRCAP